MPDVDDFDVLTARLSIMLYSTAAVTTVFFILVVISTSITAHNSRTQLFRVNCKHWYKAMSIVTAQPISSLLQMDNAKMSCIYFEARLAVAM